MGMQFRVLGREIVTKRDPNPLIYRLKVWANDPVRARSKFWYFLHKLCRIKKTKGHIISCRQILDKNSRSVKNFGLWIRFHSRTGDQNAFKEYRDLTISGAIKQLHCEMASHHKVGAACIQIIKTAELVPKKSKRMCTIQ